MKEYMRLESDSIGTMEVPEDAHRHPVTPRFH